MKTILLFSSLVFLLLGGRSQPGSSPINASYFVKPQLSSPNTAAIEKHAEFPAASYTGVPGISIPLYQIEAKGVKIPIALSYHASGIKVDEIASSIGIGWSLAAGGCINIIDNGRSDEISKYPFIVPGIFNKIKTMSLQPGYPGREIDCATAAMYYGLEASELYYLFSGNDIEFLRGVRNDLDDSEPDIYVFNFMGRSGKFFMDESGIFRTIPYSEIKVERILAGTTPDGYRITDESGNVYEFKSKEESTEQIASIASSTIVTKNRRSYFLSKITTVFNEVIDFFYSASSYTIQDQKIFSRGRFAVGSEISPCWQLNQFENYFFNNYSNITRTVGELKIDSIKTFDGTLVKFLYSSSGRLDMPGATKPLQTIEIWDIAGSRRLNRQFNLTQNYLSNRLNLTSVTETGKSPTSFTYHSTPLPAWLSYSQDHYGYYNGATNSTLLPKDEYLGFWDGADRSINENFTQAGMLTKITHSTGGTTEYIYESNEFYVPTTTTAFIKNNGVSLASVHDPFVEVTAEENFTVTSTMRNIRVQYSNEQDPAIHHIGYCKIYLLGPGGFSQQFFGNSYFPTYFNLVPGQYTLRIVTHRENGPEDFEGNINVSWFDETLLPPHNEKGGGLRIKEIKKSDGGANPVVIQKFEYNIPGTSNSSGATYFQPTYITDHSPIIKKEGEPGMLCNSISCTYLMQNSSSIFPLGFANGNFVAYSDVTTYIKDKTETGYSHTKYQISTHGQNIGYTAFPAAPAFYYDWVNGNVLEEENYTYDEATSGYKLIKSVKNYFNYDNFNPLVHTTQLYQTYGAKIGVLEEPFICHSLCAVNPIKTTLDGIYFGIQQYQFYSSWHRLDKKEERTYGANSTTPSLTTYNYFYDNPASIQVSRVETRNSKGEDIIEKIRYAKDYASYGFIANLINKNVVATPIEKYTIRKDLQGNQAVIAGEIMTFKNSGVLGDKMYKFETTTPVPVGSYTLSSINSSSVFTMDNKYKEVVSMVSYNTIGNVLQMKKANDIDISFIWDYNSTKPIAEVSNATATEIAYTSFEADGNGGWTGIDASAKLAGPISVTGEKYYKKNSFSLSKSGLTSSKPYTVSYWSKDGSYSVSGNQSGWPKELYTTTIAGQIWKLYEHKISGVTSVTLTGTGAIDELRLHPFAGQMTTYVYDRLNGVTAKSDLNGRTTYFQYDRYGRLMLTRDQEYNILNRYCYNYYNQTGACTLVGNQVTSQNFNKQNCEAGSTGNPYTYTVPVNTYYAETQADANSLAQQDIARNGQAMANSLGTCSSNCHAGNCSGINKKCVNGVCETGIKVCIESNFEMGVGMFYNTYYYMFSDGIPSGTISEYSTCDCQGTTCI